MDSINFNLAESFYKSSDYVEALKSYYAALKEDSARFESGDAGLLYYRIGNCLLKMHTFNEAAISYQKALEDTGFTAKSAAQVNLGKAQLGLGKFEDAVQAFNAALADTTYAKPYQAQMGLGNAYTKLGMIVDAGSAYRNAALDERNPNPSKALMSLGGCFMALGRPEDAVESFNAVFDFNPSQTQAQKAYESLGQAFTAAGHYAEALDAFNRALSPGGFVLSDSAQVDYNKALEALDGGQSSAAGNLDDFGILLNQASNPDLEPTIQSDGSIAYGAGNVPTAHDTGFFDVAESDLVKLSKKQMKGQRQLKHTGLKIVLGVVILLILLLGTGVLAFTQGNGLPSQEATVQSLFTAHAEGADTTQYWIGTTDEDSKIIERTMDMVAPTTAVDIDYMNKSMMTTEVIVTAHTQESGAIRYKISLVRSGIGWKISGLELYFASSSGQQSSSTQSTPQLTPDTNTPQQTPDTNTPYTTPDTNTPYTTPDTNTPYTTTPEDPQAQMPNISID